MEWGDPQNKVRALYLETFMMGRDIVIFKIGTTDEHILEKVEKLENKQKENEEKRKQEQLDRVYVVFKSNKTPARGRVLFSQNSLSLRCSLMQKRYKIQLGPR